MPNAKNVSIDEDGFLAKIMVIGGYGTGKSVFASTFPTPGFVYDFDQGIQTYRGKDFDYEQYSRDWKGWLKFEKDRIAITKLVTEGKYKTVVVDSTSSMTDIAMERALQLDPKRSATEGPIWNVHYMLVRNLMEGRLRQLVDLPCNVVVISHINIIQDQETGAVIDVAPLLTGQLAEKIPGLFDEVYFATTKRKQEEGGVTKTKWLMQTIPIGFHKARSRLSGMEHYLPDFMENNYPALIAHLKEKKGIGK